MEQMRLIRLSLLLGAVVALGGFAWLLRTDPGTMDLEAASLSATPAARDGYDGLFLPVPGGPSRPVVEDPPAVTADEAGARGVLGDEEMVLGVHLGDAARAYPIVGMLGPEQEAINDTIGGRAVLVTWCSLCNSGVVFAREVAGRPRTFHLTGELWKGNMVLADGETGSQWSQLLARSMDGPLEGQRLEVLPSTVGTWGGWRANHPETTLALLERYPEDVVRRLGYPAGGGDLVLGYAEGGEARAWPLAALRARPVVNDALGTHPVLVVYDPRCRAAFLYGREAGDRLLTFRSDGGRLIDEATGSEWDPTRGIAVAGPLRGEALEPLAAIVSERVAWRDFYPGSTFAEPPATAGGPGHAHVAP